MKKDLSALIHDISYQPTTRVSLFLSLPVEQQARVLLLLSKHVQTQLLKKLKSQDIVLLLEHLDPDEGTDLMQLLPKKQQNMLVAKLNKNLKEDITKLLEFDDKTAAGLMSLDYIQVDDTERIFEVLEQLKKHENKTGRLPTILVLSGGKLHGELPATKLIAAKKNQSAGAFVKKIPIINYQATFEKVLNVFKDNPHQKVVVTGKHNNILGVIYSDDVIQLVQMQSGSSLYDFAGVDQEENIFDTAKRKVLSRNKWLIINLFTTLIAAMTVQAFEDTISRNVLFAVYLPIVAGMGGNAGTQTLAVMVRSLSTSDLSAGVILMALKREVMAGFINGILSGIVIALIVLVINNSMVVAITLAFAMIINLVVSSFFGTLVPVLMKRLGKDPASSATIFITTATDVLGFFAFLGLATFLTS